MASIEDYGGRSFIESDAYELIDRFIVGVSSNNVWLYTVDKCKELDRQTRESTDKIVIRLIKWQARNDEHDKYIKYWQSKSRYNLRSSDEWFATSEIIELIIDKKWEDPNFIVLPITEYNKLTKSKKKMISFRKEIKQLKSEESARSIQLEVFKKRINLMKAHIKEYEKILKNFKKIIDRDDSTETEVHNYLINNNAFWMFGLEYLRFESKVKFPPGKRDFELDLTLKRYDGFWDLVELKGPNENLFDRRTTKRNKPNTKLTEALGQVITYLRACEIANLTHIFKPKAIIVIGKERTDKIQERRLLSSYLPNIDLFTYYDLYRRGKALIGIIKKLSVR